MPAFVFKIFSYQKKRDIFINVRERMNETYSAFPVSINNSCQSFPVRNHYSLLLVLSMYTQYIYTDKSINKLTYFMKLSL